MNLSTSAPTSHFSSAITLLGQGREVIQGDPTMGGVLVGGAADGYISGPLAGAAAEIRSGLRGSSNAAEQATQGAALLADADTLDDIVGQVSRIVYVLATPLADGSSARLRTDLTSTIDSIIGHLASYPGVGTATPTR